MRTTIDKYGRLFYIDDVKLSVYARQTGISYRTAWRWFKAGKLPDYQVYTGTIIVTDPTPVNTRVVALSNVAIYTRVSATENKDNLDGQAKRLTDCCAAKGYPVALVIKEVGSGVNDTRPELLKLLTDSTVTLMVVEHKDRLTRFGFPSIEPQLLELPDRRIAVIHLAENGKDDLIQDFVTLRVVTSFCARLYGQRRSRRITERLIAELQHGEEGDHPPQARPGQPQQTTKAR